MTRVWDLELPDSDKIVLLALADCANDEGHCWPSVASLVRKCSKSERTIQASIKRLVDEGLLIRREVFGKGCNYTVLPRTPAATAPRDDCAPAESAPPQGLRDTPAAAADKPSKNHQTEVKTSFAEIVERVVSAWNAMALANGLSQVRVMDASRKQSLRLRIKSVGLDAILEAIDIIGRSDWLKGEGRSNNWRPTIDFVLQPESLRKVLEGSYGGGAALSTKTPPPPMRPDQIPNAIRFWRDQGNMEKVAELEAQLVAIKAQKVAA